MSSDGNVVGGHFVPDLPPNLQEADGWEWMANQSYARALSWSQAQTVPSPMQASSSPMWQGQDVTPQWALPNIHQSFQPHAMQTQTLMSTDVNAEVPPDMSMNTLLPAQNEMYTQQHLAAYPQFFPFQHPNTFPQASPHWPQQYDFQQGLQQGGKDMPMGPGAAATETAQHAFGPRRWTVPELRSYDAGEGARVAPMHADVFPNPLTTFGGMHFHAHPNARPLLPEEGYTPQPSGDVNEPPKRLPKISNMAPRKTKANALKSTGAKRYKKRPSAAKAAPASQPAGGGFSQSAQTSAQDGRTPENTQTIGSVDHLGNNPSEAKWLEHAANVARQDAVGQEGGQVVSNSPEAGPAQALTVFLQPLEKQRSSLSSNEAPSHDPILPDEQAPLNNAQPGTSQSIETIATIPTDEPPSIKAKAESFVVAFNDYFKDSASTLRTFNGLCRAFNEKEISDVQFYRSMYRLVYPTKSEDLVAQLKYFKPQGWKGTNLDWLDKAIEGEIEQDRAEEEARKGLSEHKEPRPEPKIRKKVPVNGFRAGDVESPQCSVVTKRNAPPMKTRDWNAGNVSNAAENETAPRYPKDSASRPSKVVKLPVGSALARVVQNVTPQKRKVAKTNMSPPTPDDTPNKKPRFGSVPGSQVEHFGPVYPTRRAVLARADKPYICAICGNAYMHPVDVMHHHGGYKRSANGRGCWERSGNPAGAAASWDSHESCRVSYPNINYTKVSDGYVILDQESWNKIENACEAGRRFKRENGIRDVHTSDGVSSSGLEAASSGPETEEAQPATFAASSDADNSASASEEKTARMPKTPSRKAKSTPKKLVKAGDENETTLRAAALGLRRKK